MEAAVGGQAGGQVGDAVAVEIARSGQFRLAGPAAADQASAAQLGAGLTGVQVKTVAPGDGQQIGVAVAGEVADRGDLAKCLPAGADLFPRAETGGLPGQAVAGMSWSDSVTFWSQRAKST